MSEYSNFFSNSANHRRAGHSVKFEKSALKVSLKENFGKQNLQNPQKLRKYLYNLRQSFPNPKNETLSKCMGSGH